MAQQMSENEYELQRARNSEMKQYRKKESEEERIKGEGRKEGRKRGRKGGRKDFYFCDNEAAVHDVTLGK